MQQLGMADGLQTLFKKSMVTHRRQFLAEMDRLVVPWDRMLALNKPVYPKGQGPKGGCPPHALAMMLRLHLLQQWFGYSAPAMEEALHETPLLRQFTRLSAASRNLPDEIALLHFGNLLERNALASVLFDAVNGLPREQGLLLKTGTVIDATLMLPRYRSRTRIEPGTRRCVRSRREISGTSAPRPTLVWMPIAGWCITWKSRRRMSRISR